MEPAAPAPMTTTRRGDLGVCGSVVMKTNANGGSRALASLDAMNSPENSDRRGRRTSNEPNRGTAGEPGTVSIARALSKLGFCSRAQGDRLVEAGKVRVNGAVVRSQSVRVRPERDVIEVDGTRVAHVAHVYLMLNKPRGLVTTTDDPQGRATIYECLRDASLPFVAPVGRLDKASEGLLVLTNDSRWSARLLDPASHVDKVYHVQVRTTNPESIVDRVARGIVDGATGERLEVKSISVLRTGSRSGAWLEVVLDEGKNRQLRRIFAALDVPVQRLVRVAIGRLTLGDLAKGAWRMLRQDEVDVLGGTP
jgi:23S rRNA pseudouridine2605 synthase